MHVGGGLGVDQLRQDLGEASVQVSVHIRKTQVLDEASSAGSGSAIACAGLVRAGRGAGTDGCRADRSLLDTRVFSRQLDIARFM